MSSDSEATMSSDIEMSSVPTTPRPPAAKLPAIDTSANRLSQSSVDSEARTLYDSPLQTGRRFSLISGETPPEKLDAILEEYKERLCWITPRATHRFDQPAGRPNRKSSSRSSGSSPRTSISNPRPDTTTDVEVRKPPTRRVSSLRFRRERDKTLGYEPLDGWQKQVTPDGFPFFIKDDGDFVFITDTFIPRPELLADIEYWRKVLRRVARAHKYSDPEDCPLNCEIYLRVEQQGGPCYYYMINHDDRLVFWVHDVEEDELGLDESIPDSGLELVLQTEFWTHLELFPHRIPPDAEEKLRGMLIYANIDSATAPGSTSIYSLDQCSLFLSDLDRLSTAPTDIAVRHHFIARLTKAFCNNRCLNFYGEEGARIDRAQRSHNPNSASNMVVVKVVLWVLRLCVLGMDARQLERIQEVVVDDVVLPRLWKSFLGAFVRGIDQSNIVAAIIFNANVGFLAINDLNSLQSTSSLVSTLFSLSSLLIGLHHVRQHNSLVDTDAHIGAAYFLNASYDSFGGYQLLAFFHCLPFALLIWSILMFCLTIALLATQITDSLGWGVFLGTGSIQLLLLMFTLFFFWKIWEPADKDRPWLNEATASFVGKMEYFSDRIRGKPIEPARPGDEAS